MATQKPKLDLKHWLMWELSEVMWQMAKGADRVYDVFVAANSALSKRVVAYVERKYPIGEKTTVGNPTE